MTVVPIPPSEENPHVERVLDQGREARLQYESKRGMGVEILAEDAEDPAARHPHTAAKRRSHPESGSAHELRIRALWPHRHDGRASEIRTLVGALRKRHEERGAFLHECDETYRDVASTIERAFLGIRVVDHAHSDAEELGRIELPCSTCGGERAGRVLVILGSQDCHDCRPAGEVLRP